MNGYHLFEAFGLELEYMIVNRESLPVLPAADTIFIRETGWPCSSFDAGEITWSNEMMLHVIELKTTHPEKDLARLPSLFSDSVRKINNLLRTDNGRLLPTGSHPLMNPVEESRLWPHENTVIYGQYDKIFDCSGHGWSNLQSTHINLPFTGDDEFGVLHAAVRFLLPLIPGLCASSPVIEGFITGWQDSRMKHYMDNQKRIPVIAGRIVPEPVYSRTDYENKIFHKIEKAIAPHDPSRILDKHFLNSRGAIARFDRNSIEIRVMDIQESPLADIACAALIIELTRKLVSDAAGIMTKLKKYPTERLKAILMGTSRFGGDYQISDRDYLSLWGAGKGPCKAGKLWQDIAEPLLTFIPENLRTPLETILSRGTLSGSLLKDLGPNPDKESIIRVWNKTAQCLDGNSLYI